MTTGTQELSLRSPQPDEPRPPYGWFKAVRSDEGLELIAMNPCAFSLLYVIAHRANWHGKFNRHGLGLGQAFIGDYKRCGMSQRQYRTAKGQLEKHRFATFKPTNKGTVATLADSRVFVLSGKPDDNQNDRQRTGSRQTEVQRRATNKDREELKNGKKERGPSNGTSRSGRMDYSKGF